MSLQPDDSSVDATDDDVSQQRYHPSKSFGANACKYLSPLTM